MGLFFGHNIKFTPIQQKIMDILSNGRGHTKHDLLPCVGDPEAEPVAVVKHIYLLRKVLSGTEYGILNEELQGKRYYRLVRFIIPDADTVSNS